MSYKPLILIFAVLLNINLFAQHNEEVTVEGTYRPKVNKVDKILMQAETPEQSFTMPSADVQILEIQKRIPMKLDRINAMTLNKKDGLNEKFTKNFLMAGLGTRLTPVFFYKHHSMLTKTLGLGVGIDHYSSWMGMKDYAYSGFMNNRFDIALSSTRFNNLQLRGNLYYDNDVVHYYGVPLQDWTGSDAALEQAAPRQTYNTIGLRLAMASTTTRRGEFYHNGDFDYHYMFALLGGSEHYSALNYDLGYMESWWGKRDNPQKAGVKLSFEYDSYAGGAHSPKVHVRRYLGKVNPYFEMKDEFFRLHLGLCMGLASRIHSMDRLLTVHPDLKGSLFVLDKKVEFYAGLNGGRKIYTLGEMVAENPFVTSDLDMEMTTVKLGFEGGVRTNLMQTLDVHAGVRYRHTLNDPFYSVISQSNAVQNAFEVIYDDTRLVSVLADVRWLAWDKITVDAGLVINRYKNEVLDCALYRPRTEGKLKVNYEFNDQLSLYSSFLYQGGRFGRLDPVLACTPSFKLSPVLDLGIGADYKVRDELTVFAKFNNLLHQKYLLYVNYPVTGIEFFAGVKMRF